jgi:hypothetical protein
MLAARLGAVGAGFTGALYFYAPARFAALTERAEQTGREAAAFSPSDEAGRVIAQVQDAASTQYLSAQKFLSDKASLATAQVAEAREEVLGLASAALPPQRVDNVDVLLPSKDHYNGSVIQTNSVVAYASAVLNFGSENSFRDTTILDGWGTMNYADGRIYSGGFRDNMRHGRGRLVGTAGDVLEGDFSNGECCGAARWSSLGGSEVRHSPRSA